jgi:Bcr/CflA subfamily drug resistance transporter
MSNLEKLNRTPSAFLLILLLGFPQLSETVYTPSLPDIAHFMSASSQWVESTLSIYFVGFALGVLAWGTLADMCGRRKSLLAGIVIYILGSAGCRFSVSIESLLLCRFVQALGASAGSVVSQTIIRDSFTGKERNQFFSLVGASLSATPAIGPLLGGLIDQHFGWQADFTFLIGLGLFILLLTFLQLPETLSKAQSSQMTAKPKVIAMAKQLLRDPKVIAYALIIGACNGLIFSYYGEGSFVFIDLLGLLPSQYGLFGMVIAAATLMASMVSLRMNNKVNSERIVFYGCAITLLGVALLKIITLLQGFYLLSNNGTAALMLLSCAISFVGIGLIIPNCLSQALSGYTHSVGTAGSLFGFGYYLLISCFTCGMALFHNGTLSAMPNYFLCLSLVLILTSIWIDQTARNPKQALART